MKLSPEENELLESVENDEWVQIPDYHQAAEQYQDYARSSLKKEKRVNIRMTERDLTHLQKQAIREGLPYQTFISTILHKYITGNLKEC